MLDTDHAAGKAHDCIKELMQILMQRVCIISSEESDKWGMSVLPERQADIKAFSMGLHLLSLRLGRKQLDLDLDLCSAFGVHKEV